MRNAPKGDLHLRYQATDKRKAKALQLASCSRGAWRMQDIDEKR
jgi:hypothetical protein